MSPSIGEASEASTDLSIWNIVALARTQVAMLNAAGRSAARHGTGPCAKRSMAAASASAAGAMRT